MASRPMPNKSRNYDIIFEYLEGGEIKTIQTCQKILDPVIRLVAPLDGRKAH